MAHDLVAQALANPGRLPFLALGEWARLLRHAQRSQLLARVAVSAIGHQAEASLPQQPRLQLERVQQATVRQRQQRRLDLQDLMRLIAPIGVDVVALKGTAHWLCDIGPTNDSQFAKIHVPIPWRQHHAGHGGITDHPDFGRIGQGVRRQMVQR